MSAKANTAKIGLFVILAVVLLVAGLLLFGAKSYFVPKSKGETAIPGEVYGLSVGSGVQLRGVPIGKVTRITFAWALYPHTKSSFIVVEFEVEQNLFPLPPGMDMKTAAAEAVARGMRAMVKGQGITGTSILALETLDPKAYPPPHLDYTPRQLYIPSAPPQLTRLVDSLGKSLTHLQEVDFAGISHGATNTLAAARDLVARLSEVDFKGLDTNANALLVGLKGSSTKLNTTLEDLQKTINRAKLYEVSTNANGLLAGLRDSNAKLQIVLDNLGAVPMQQAVANLQESLRTLNEVLVELKAYPSGFLLGKPPPPVEALQPARQ